MSLFEAFNLGQGFRKYFRIEAASSTDVRDEVFRVRHEVYCEELGFEPVRAGSARDRRLRCAQHSLPAANLLNEPFTLSAALAWCWQIHATPAPLPFEKACAATLDRSIIDPSKLHRGKIAEVSRLAVRSHFRRRKVKADSGGDSGRGFRFNGAATVSLYSDRFVPGRSGDGQAARHRNAVRAHGATVAVSFRQARRKDQTDRRARRASGNQNPLDDGCELDHQRPTLSGQTRCGPSCRKKIAATDTEVQRTS